MIFLIQTIWLGLKFQDFKEDDIKGDMTIDDVNFTLVLFFIIKKIPKYLKEIMQKTFEPIYFDIHNLNPLFYINC